MEKPFAKLQAKMPPHATMRLILLFLSLLIGIAGFGGAPAQAAEITSLVLSKNELTLEEGATASLTATAIYVGGTTEIVTIKTDWNSGSPEIATVYAGAVTAKKEGKAVLTATYLDRTVIVNVTVTKKVRSLIANKQSIDLRQGGSEQIALTAYYNDGTSEDVSQKAEWNIDNGSVATVVNGLITGQSAGTATVTAAYNNQSAVIPVNVEIVKRVDPEKSELSLLSEDTESLKLFATYPDGTTEDVADKAVWTSDNPAVADALKGKITGYGPGQATITAAYGTKSASIRVDVDNALKLDIDKTSLLLRRNATYQLKLTATYANDSSEDITDRAEWISADDSIVSVSKGRLIAGKNGETTVTARYGQKSLTVRVDVEVPRRLELSRETLDLKAGDSEQLTLEATYADGTRSTVTEQADWTVADENTVAVLNGKVTAYKSGETTVTASYGGKTATAKIHVDIPRTLTPSKKKVSFQVGGSEQIALTAVYPDGREEDVAGKAVWTAGTPGIVDIRGGLVSGIGTGAVTVTASYGTRSASIQVSVGVLDSLTTSGPARIALKVGDKRTYDLTAKYADGTVKDAAADADWTSSNPAAVTVDKGVVKAVASGKATIAAQLDQKTVTIEVEVDLANSLTANPAMLSFDVGQSRTVTLTAVDMNGDDRDVTVEAEWSSSHPEVAQVSRGIVTAVSRGKTTITAKYGGKTVTIPLEVGVVEALEASARFLSTKTGESVQIRLTATLTDGSEKDVSAEAAWKSSNYRIADVRDGLVTGIGSGKATITASFGGKQLTIPVDVDTMKYLKTDKVVATMSVGETLRIKAEATYIDGKDEDVTVAALWKSSNIRIADVKDGIITATGKGRATITVTYAKMRTTVVITVK